MMKPIKPSSGQTDVPQEVCDLFDEILRELDKWIRKQTPEALALMTDVDVKRQIEHFKEKASAMAKERGIGWEEYDQPKYLGVGVGITLAPAIMRSRAR